MEMSASSTPIVCDMTDAADTAEERMAEYGRLFAQALTGRERTDEGVRLRFRADDGVEGWVRDLAARDKACCPFYDFAVTTTAGEVWLEVGVVDGVGGDDVTRTLLDEYYDAPDTVAAGVAGMKQRFTERGWEVATNPAGTVMQAHRASGAV